MGLDELPPAAVVYKRPKDIDNGIRLRKREMMAIAAGVLIVITVITTLLALFAPSHTYYSIQPSYNCTSIPCSYVSNGNFTFIFKLLNGSVEGWYFPQSTYDEYLNAPRYTPTIDLKFNNNTLVYTYDYRALITPSFFSAVVPSMTKGGTAPQFVSEVVDLKNQLTAYSLVFQNTSAYPAVILALGKGDCKDFAVLMASILEAGNQEANYGMKIQFVYVDAYNLSDPTTINHLILYITFANGTGEFIDTTNILSTSGYTPVIKGWYFNLTCNATSCQATQACQSGYTYGNNGLCHLACGGGSSYCSTGDYCYNNHCVSCPAGTLLGNDGLCHASCGQSSTYCSGNSQCYNNHCVSCPAGTVLGSDGACHQECGGSNSYCSNGTVCSSGECASCPPGTVLGSDGLCHMACGLGYCNSTSYCSSNQCISCASGYYVGTDGQCHLLTNSS